MNCARNVVSVFSGRQGRQRRKEGPWHCATMRTLCSLKQAHAERRPIVAAAAAVLLLLRLLLRCLMRRCDADRYAVL